jgi:hypothetical protein
MSDLPGPLRRSDLTVRLVAESFVVFTVVVVFILLASIVGYQP